MTAGDEQLHGGATGGLFFELLQVREEEEPTEERHDEGRDQGGTIHAGKDRPLPGPAGAKRGGERSKVEGKKGEVRAERALPAGSARLPRTSDQSGLDASTRPVMTTGRAFSSRPALARGAAEDDEQPVARL